MSNTQYGFGGGSFGVISFGGIIVTPPPQPIFDELYLRNYLNDELSIGASYIPISDLFTIAATQSTLTLTNTPTPYKSVSIRLNGHLLSTSTYSVVGAVVHFTFNLVNGNTVEVDYWH